MSHRLDASGVHLSRPAPGIHRNLVLAAILPSACRSRSFLLFIHDKLGFSTSWLSDWSSGSSFLATVLTRGYAGWVTDGQGGKAVCSPGLRRCLRARRLALPHRGQAEPLPAARRLVWPCWSSGGWAWCRVRWRLSLSPAASPGYYRSLLSVRSAPACRCPGPQHCDVRGACHRRAVRYDALSGLRA